MLRPVFVAAVICMWSASAASGASILVETDWATRGDGRLTRDFASGLDWLDLTVTHGKSFNEVSALLGRGRYRGFRYATESEVIGLWATAGFVGPSGFKTANYQPMLDLMALIGTTRDEPGCCGGPGNNEPFRLRAAFGIIAGAIAAGTHQVAILETLQFVGIPPNSAPVGQSRINFSILDSTGTLGGSYLVRGIPAVPEPGTLSLMAAGVATGLARVWRHRRSRR